MVGEAGWTAATDHVLIAYTLAYRWAEMRKRWPKLRFVDVIRGYCASVGGGRPSPRQRWVRALPGPREQDWSAPQGWPPNVSWPRHEQHWRSVLRRAAAWGRGELPDPSGGEVWHFGATNLEPDVERARRAVEAGRWCRLRILGTRNAFYGRC